MSNDRSTDTMSPETERGMTILTLAILSSGLFMIFGPLL